MLTMEGTMTTYDDAVARAVEKGETQGFMKIVVDADTKQILGAAVLGPGGDEVIHCVLDLMYAKAPYHIPTMLGELRLLECRGERRRGRSRWKIARYGLRSNATGGRIRCEGFRGRA
jgi:hypothetical protein